MNLSLESLNKSLHRWWLAYQTIQVFLIILIICSLSIQSWVFSNFDLEAYYQDSKNNDQIFKSNLFKGSLLSCVEGCTKSQSYEIIAEDICSYLEKVENGAFLNQNVHNSLDELRTICNLFQNLLNYAKAKIFFDSLSIFIIFIWSVSGFHYFKRFKRFWLANFSSFCGFFIYLIGSLIWLVGVEGNFESCSTYPDDGSTPTLCLSSGPKIVIFTMIFFFFSIIGYLIKAWIVRKSYLLKDGIILQVSHHKLQSVFSFPIDPIDNPPYFNPHNNLDDFIELTSKHQKNSKSEQNSIQSKVDVLNQLEMPPAVFPDFASSQKILNNSEIVKINHY
jgi:hypothetical protein